MRRSRELARRASARSASMLTLVQRRHRDARRGRVAGRDRPGVFKGTSRNRTESDLRCYLAWCAERSLDPLAAQRPNLELYIRWMQEIRRFKPSTVSRRFSVVAGFYRTCVVDGVLQHSPAEHGRRPSVPTESPTLGFTHLQFEALLMAARESSNPIPGPPCCF